MKENPKKSHKLSDVEFWEGIRACGGLYSRSVRYFKEKFNVDITRVAVKLRAEKNPDLLEDIREETKDIAEETLQHFIRSEKDKKLKLEAVKFFLERKAKDRGYTKEDKESAIKRIEVEIIGDDEES